MRDPKDCKAVMPSDECCACRTYVCTRCERRRPWGDGASDDTPALCDDCAMAVRSGVWQDEDNSSPDVPNLRTHDDEARRELIAFCVTCALVIISLFFLYSYH